jgi:hypothetical protein
MSPNTFALLILLSATSLLSAENEKKPAVELSSNRLEIFEPRPKGTLTFAKDVAPIIFEKCASCHRPGQSAPFSLLTYADVRRRTDQIADVTRRRYMPPWLPEPGYGEFAEERRLTSEQLGLLQQWLAEGAPEGDPSQLPPPRKWAEGWQLGQPDLVVSLPRYVLAAEGKDVYRNLVAAIPVSSTRFVKGVEFVPGNPRIVHHAFIEVDRTRQCRRLAAKENPPGFNGMELPESAAMPQGQLLGWQPGKTPNMVDPGLAWVLKTNTDLVLQLHLHPTGKPETIEPKVGFYFTDERPSPVLANIRLIRFDFELPPGSSNCLVEQSYTLPVGVDLLRILPHCHYLGKDLQSYALLPDGQKQGLLWIKDWDFNWQGDYKYARPISLPKGTKLVMRYIYDNSTNNLRNPNSPPKLVRHGLQTTDEMADLSLQVLPHSPEDFNTLAQDYFGFFRRISMDYYEHRLRLDPNDVEAHVKEGRALHSLDRIAEARTHLTSAIQLDPNDAQAHYELGYLYLRQQQLPQAFQEFQLAVRRNPEDYQAFGSLGYICLAYGKKEAARSFLTEALRLNPEDPVARRNLAVLDTPPSTP